MRAFRCILLVALSAIASQAARAGTLDTVKARGALQCGVHPALPGFGMPNANGIYSGLDVDLCRALAAAIFNDPDKVRFTPTTAAVRFTAVATGEVDVLARNSTFTLTRDTVQGLNFPAINFFDGQGFLVRRSAHVASAKDLDGASICVAQGSTAEQNLADFFRAHSMRLETVTFAANEEAVMAMQAGRCDAYTTDRSGLASERVKFARPDDFVILPEIISREPLGPAVRHGDDQWADIVRWTHYAMVTAEDLGVTRANVDAMVASAEPEVRRLLGVESKLGEALGLTNDWVQRIVRHVGNYGESFERNIGNGSALKLERGQNALTRNGGLQYSYPFR